MTLLLVVGGGDTGMVITVVREDALRCGARLGGATRVGHDIPGVYCLFGNPRIAAHAAWRQQTNSLAARTRGDMISVPVLAAPGAAAC